MKSTEWDTESHSVDAEEGEHKLKSSINGTLLSLYIMQCHRFNQSIQIWPHGVFCFVFFLNIHTRVQLLVCKIRRAWKKSKVPPSLRIWNCYNEFQSKHPFFHQIPTTYILASRRQQRNKYTKLSSNTFHKHRLARSCFKKKKKNALTSDQNVSPTNTQQLSFCSSQIQYCHSSSLQRRPWLLLSSLEFEESFIVKDLPLDEVRTE